MEERDTLVFDKDFDIADFVPFVEEFDLRHRASRPAASPGAHAQEIWTNEDETVAIHVVYDTGTGVYYAWIHGYDIYPWVVALNARYLTWTVSHALREVESSTTLEERVMNLTRLGLVATEPDARVTEVLRKHVEADQPDPVRLAVVRILGVVSSPEHQALLERVRDTDAAPNIRDAAAAALQVLAQGMT